MFKKLLIIARDFNQAQHWAKDKKMSPGQWVYVSSFHNVMGNAASEYVLLDKYKERPDLNQILAALETTGCTERQLSIST